MAHNIEEIIIEVTSATKAFKLPHERHNSLKSLIINFYKNNRSFEQQLALKNVSFKVKKGEFLGIVGRNGGGKSTLLKLLAGIYSPSKGSVVVHGKLTPFIELGVGFNQELSGRENVYLNGALLGFSHKEIDVMYHDIVQFAELERFMDQKLKNYSSGMQVRLAFSIAIRAKSDILLLDEVLAVGDAAFQQKCYNYFEELKRQGQTVVFVSHDMGAIRRFCTRAIYIESGKLTHEGTAAQVADMYTADNIEASQDSSPDNESNKIVDTRSVRTKILQQTASELLLQLSYKSKDTTEMYAGISVLRNGMSVAEINTLPDKTLVGSGEIFYPLDITIFNPGVYEITVALFAVKNRELISIGKNKSRFIIKGSDYTRGGAFKLANTWKLKNEKSGQA